MRDIDAVLFDLDDTLLDREATFAAYCRDLMSRCFPAGVDTDEALAFMRKADNHGDEIRAVFCEKVAKRWALSCTAREMEAEWTERFSSFAAPVPGLFGVLDALAPFAKLGIITNGKADMQNAKIDALGIRSRFSVILISSEVGVRKPDPSIFHMACGMLGVSPARAAFVGDNPIADVAGALSAGLRAVWLSAKGEPAEGAAVIRSMGELPSLLAR